jgi:hypothetical protein
MQRTISPINQEAPTDSLRTDVVSFARAPDASLLVRMFAFMRGPPLMVKCPKEKRRGSGISQSSFFILVARVSSCRGQSATTRP